MVRLVTSRVHRCYSRSGAQRSARNERLNDIAHLVACTTALVDKDISFSTFGKAIIIPASTAAFGFFLLFLVHLFDLYATFNAHNMFYRWSRQFKKKREFLSCPTKVDAIVASSYFFSSVVFYLFASAVVLKGKSAEERAYYVQVATAILNVVGTFANMTLSLPSTEYDVPAGMSRAQNAVVAMFNTASVMKLYSALLETSAGPLGASGYMFLRKTGLLADVLIWLGSVLNFLRVSKLLAKVQLWIKEELSKSGKGNQKGLLSWFKTSRANSEIGDGDSEDFEDVSYDTEDPKGGK